MQVKTEKRIRVNGFLMGQNIGKEVTLVGEVLSASPDGSSFDMKTSDKRVITVVLSQPASSPVSGLVEVQGVARTKNSIACDYHMVFPDEQSEDYDAEIANEVAILINSVPNPWKS